MTTYSFEKSVLSSGAGELANLIEARLAQDGITQSDYNLSYSEGNFNIDVELLTTQQQTDIAAIIDAYVFVDYAGLSEAAKPNAKTVLSDMEALYDFAAPYYTGLSGSQKAAILANLTTDWNTATAAQKADALRALLSLIVVAIYFIYLKFIDNGN